MTRPPLHAVTWFLWALAAAATVQLAPNPLYVAVVIAAAAVVVEAHGGDRPLRRAFPLLLGVGVVFAVVRVVLTGLTTHTGIGTLVELPEATLPGLFGGFTVGGTVDAGVLARAAAEGFALVGVMAAFGAFNAVVAHDELVRVAPKAFHEVGLIVTVALAFVPSTIAAVAAVREADRARTGGTVVRRGRLLRQILPVLESGLEKAIHLAESMDARGFGHLPAAPREVAGGWLGGVGLLAIAGSFLALVGRAQAVAGALVAVGVVAVLAAVAVAGRGSHRARYRPRRLTRIDRAIALGALTPPAVLAILAALDDPTLVWPRSPLGLPALNAVALVAVAALAVPALVVRTSGARQAGP